MSRLKLTLACGDYDFLRPLINGEIQRSHSLACFMFRIR